MPLFVGFLPRSIAFRAWACSRCPPIDGAGRAVVPASPVYGEPLGRRDLLHAVREPGLVEKPGGDLPVVRVPERAEGEARDRRGVGDVGVGEASVIIATASPHRSEAFEACRYAIEELKARAPIWKAERFTDGRVWMGSPARSGPPEGTVGADTEAGGARYDSSDD